MKNKNGVSKILINRVLRKKYGKKIKIKYLPNKKYFKTIGYRSTVYTYLKGSLHYIGLFDDFEIKDGTLFLKGEKINEKVT